MTAARITPVLLVTTLLATTACETEEVEHQDQDTAALEVAEDCNEPTQLYDLDELMEALRAGKDVRVGIYYGHCTIDGSSVMDAQGGMTVETFEWFGKGAIGNDEDYVAFSKSSLVLMSGYHYLDYVKVRVYESGAVDVIAEYLNPVTYEVDMYEEFDCELDQGDGGQITIFAR